MHGSGHEMMGGELCTSRGREQWLGRTVQSPMAGWVWDAYWRQDLGHTRARPPVPAGPPGRALRGLHASGQEPLSLGAWAHGKHHGRWLGQSLGPAHLEPSTCFLHDCKMGTATSKKMMPVCISCAFPVCLTSIPRDTRSRTRLTPGRTRAGVQGPRSAVTRGGVPAFSSFACFLEILGRVKLTPCHFSEHKRSGRTYPCVDPRPGKLPADAVASHPLRQLPCAQQGRVLTPGAGARVGGVSSQVRSAPQAKPSAPVPHPTPALSKWPGARQHFCLRHEATPASPRPPSPAPSRGLARCG